MPEEKSLSPHRNRWAIQQNVDLYVKLEGQWVGYHGCPIRATQGYFSPDEIAKQSLTSRFASDILGHEQIRAAANYLDFL